MIEKQAIVDPNFTPLLKKATDEMLDALIKNAQPKREAVEALDDDLTKRLATTVANKLQERTSR